jgi:hypothetical protein
MWISARRTGSSTAVGGLDFSVAASKLWRDERELQPRVDVLFASAGHPQPVRADQLAAVKRYPSAQRAAAVAPRVDGDPVYQRAPTGVLGYSQPQRDVPP